MLAWDIVKVLGLLVLVDLPWLMLTGPWTTALIRRVQLIAVDIRWWAAALVYVALAVIVFTASSVWQAGVLGVATYAVYEFTNLSTFVMWDWKFSVADTLWGGALLATVKWASGV
jgi:uncharacterized membrane protein